MVQESSLPGQPSSGARRIRLLLADDHPMMRWALKAFLQKHPDVEVVAEAADGEQAVKLAAELQPDVVIMDISMPKMSGLEATRLIKSAQPQTAILVLTIHDEPQVVLSILEAGAAGYLIKNVFGEEVIHAVRGVASGDTVLAPEIWRLTLKRAARYNTQPIPLGAGQKLTPRELEILRLAARGLSNKQIAEDAGLSVRTVKGYLADSFSKLGVGSRTEAVMFCMRAGILNIEDIS